MGLVRHFRQLPASMRLIASINVFVAAIAVYDALTGWPSLLSQPSLTTIVFALGFVVLPVGVTALLLFRKLAAVPLYALQCSLITWHTILTPALTSQEIQALRWVFVGALFVLGLFFCSRDILFPLLSTSRRTFRLAPRYYTNRQVFLVGHNQEIPLTLENCSVTGLAAFGEIHQLTALLDELGDETIVPLRMGPRLDSPQIEGYIVSRRNDGTHLRLGISTNNSKAMAKYILSLQPRAKTLGSRLSVIWVGSHLQRLALLTWSVAMLGALIVPMFAPSMAASIEANESHSIGTTELEIEVSGFASNEGRVRLAIDNSPETYLVKEFRSADAKIIGGKASIRLNDLPPGTYAVRLFHDENDNGELDTNLLGIPTEPYGFSQDARATFGAPSFDDSKFIIEPSGTKIKIHVKTHI